MLRPTSRRRQCRRRPPRPSEADYSAGGRAFLPGVPFARAVEVTRRLGTVGNSAEVVTRRPGKVSESGLDGDGVPWHSPFGSAEEVHQGLAGGYRLDRDRNGGSRKRSHRLPDATVSLARASSSSSDDGGAFWLPRLLEPKARIRKPKPRHSRVKIAMGESAPRTIGASPPSRFEAKCRRWQGTRDAPPVAAKPGDGRQSEERSASNAMHLRATPHRVNLPTGGSASTVVDPRS